MASNLGQFIYFFALIFLLFFKLFVCCCFFLLFVCFGGFVNMSFKK